MFIHKETQKRIAEGMAFEIDGTQFPNNWLNLTSKEEKEKHGIFELISHPLPEYDSELFRVYVSPDLEEVDGVFFESWKQVPLSEEEIASKLKSKLLARQQEIYTTLTQIDAKRIRPLAEGDSKRLSELNEQAKALRAELVALK